MTRHFVFILTVSLALTACNHGQTEQADTKPSFKNDWATFTAPNWTITFLPDTSSHFDKQAQGNLVFQNKTDSITMVSYGVFIKSQTDEQFKKKIFDWRFIQSCLEISTTGMPTFSDFDYKDNFYLLLNSCHNCHVSTNKDCEALAKTIKDFIQKNR